MVDTENTDTGRRGNALLSPSMPIANNCGVKRTDVIKTAHV